MVVYVNRDGIDLQLTIDGEVAKIETAGSVWTGRRDGNLLHFGEKVVSMRQGYLEFMGETWQSCDLLREFEAIQNLGVLRIVKWHFCFFLVGLVVGVSISRAKTSSRFGGWVSQSCSLEGFRAWGFGFTHKLFSGTLPHSFQGPCFSEHQQNPRTNSWFLKRRGG